MFAEHHAHDLGQRGKLEPVLRKAFFALLRDAVVTALPAGFPGAPGGLNQAPFLQPVKHGIDRAFAGLENPRRLRVEVLNELVAVARPVAQDGEDQRLHITVEGFLGEFHDRLDGV